MTPFTNEPLNSEVHENNSFLTSLAVCIKCTASPSWFFLIFLNAFPTSSSNVSSTSRHWFTASKLRKMSRKCSFSLVGWTLFKVRPPCHLICSQYSSVSLLSVKTAGSSPLLPLISSIYAKISAEAIDSVSTPPVNYDHQCEYRMPISQISQSVKFCSKGPTNTRGDTSAVNKTLISRPKSRPRLFVQDQDRDQDFELDSRQYQDQDLI